MFSRQLLRLNSQSVYRYVGTAAAVVVGGTAFGALLGPPPHKDLLLSSTSSSSSLLVSATPTTSTSTAYCEAPEEKSKKGRLSRCVIVRTGN